MCPRAGLLSSKAMSGTETCNACLPMHAARRRASLCGMLGISANHLAGTGRCGRHAQSLSGVASAAASALRATGLNLGVATMRKGEHCTLHVDAQYGYGDAGAPACLHRT